MSIIILSILTGGFLMADYRLRAFEYHCSCGYMVKVFIDFGVPQNVYKCRKCGRETNRQDV